MDTKNELVEAPAIQAEPQEESPPKPAGPLRRFWQRSRGWALVLLSIMTLPLIEPAVATVLSKIPGVDRVVTVEFSEEFTTQVAPIRELTRDDVTGYFAGGWQRLMESDARNVVLCVASIGLLLVVIARNFVPAVIILRRQRESLFTPVFMLIGVVIWLRIAVGFAAGIIGADGDIATAALPSYEMVENGLTYGEKLLEGWVSTQTYYFGFNLAWLDLFDFLAALEFFLLILSLHIGLLFACFTCFALFNYRWEGVFDAKKAPAPDGGRED